MLQSQLFSKTRKDAPKDEVSKNAQLLIRAGFIHKEMAGVYSFLPLGWRVMNNIMGIIREEMNAIGGSEMFMPSLQERTAWEKSGRWNDEIVDNWFKTKLKNGTEIGLAFTHEENLTTIMRDYIRSWRDLPVYPFQIQNKFRNEARAKSGIMRTREFLMKDMYSFSRDADEHSTFYEKSKVAYQSVYKRAGLGDVTFLTFASGGSFSKYSHEFQAVTSAGEDHIYICDKCKVAINDEVRADFNDSCPVCTNKELRKETSVEVGNIFNLGTKYSEALELYYVDEKGEKKPVVMGSYGIGPARLMGTIVEVLSDDAGIVWPESVAPFKVHLVSVLDKGGKVKNYADQLYAKLVDKGVSVLYDDRDIRAGEKFADSDLVGIPKRIVVSEKTLAEEKLELVTRKTKEAKKVAEGELFTELAG